MLKDPICGMEVEGEKFVYEIEGRKYFFCSAGCLDKFKNITEKYVYDLVIIGAGPAGLTAAVHASVLKINTFLISKNIGGQAIENAHINNYMGFDFITGKELVNKFEHQLLQEHYIDHKLDEVIKINRIGTIFEVVTRQAGSITTFAVIIATGIRQKILGVPGEERLLRRGISYYHVQESALFEGMDVAVVGGGVLGVEAALQLRNSGCRVTLISKDNLSASVDDIKELKKGGNICILEGYKVIEIKGEDRVEGIIVQSSDMASQKKITCKAVFIEAGYIPNTEFCRDLIKSNEAGEIIINNDCSTNMEGVFACGDVTDYFGKRIIIASGEGAKASLSAKKYLLEMGIR